LSIKLNPEFLSPISINWSLEHIKRYGDTDIFPIPFEYEAYDCIRTELVDYLCSLNLAEYKFAPYIKYLIPKHGIGYRAAIQLDPIDCIIYNSAIFEISEDIENYRINKDLKIACSNRIEIAANGEIFKKDSGWEDFKAKSYELANDSNCNYVLLTDISDFYNQISHHRVQNSISSSGILENKSKIIERLLNNLNASQHSRGIPVGPTGSIPLSEACLNDVDNFLIRNGIKHTRYVDDFRIFCNSFEQALKALHDLTEYLHLSHRLSVQDSKTIIKTKDEFKNKDLYDPELNELFEKRNKISEFIDSLNLPSFFNEEDIEIDDDQDAEFTRDAIKDLFDEMIKNKNINYGLARYLLRRSSTLRTRIILQLVLDNLEDLLPVYRDVIHYILSVYDKSKPDQVSNSLIYFIKHSNYRFIPFVQYWTIDALLRNIEFCSFETFIEIVDNSNKEISERMMALVAKQYDSIDWLRSRKENWKNTSEWTQRAIIWSSSVLPKDERNHWLSHVEQSASKNTSLLAKATRIKYHS
jgi:hypothetical protein